MKAQRELVMELRVPLSGELRADANVIIASGKIEDALKESATEAFPNGYTLKVETVTKREGAGRKAAAAAAEPATVEAVEDVPAVDHPARGRRQANGTGEPATA
jgi:hypothetical protein